MADAVAERGIGGFARDGFEPIDDVFGRLITALGVGGAALAIYRDGRLVVDLWGGDYTRDALQVVHSVTKIPSAMAARVAIARGLLDPHEPLAEFWPEFALEERRAITTDMVLAHRAGLPAVRRPLALSEMTDGRDEDAIAVEPLFWEPGTAHGYHGHTMGSLLNGVFRRRVGTTVGEYVASTFADPLGLDLHIGTPDALHDRVVPVIAARAQLTPRQRERLARGDLTIDGHFAILADDPHFFERPEVLRQAWPAVNGVSGARDLARLLAASMGEVDGVRVLDEGSLAELVRPRSCGPDRVLGVPSRFGSGVQLAFPQLPFLGPGSFGHEGAGGALAFADIDHGIAVGYTTNVVQSVNGAALPALALLPVIRHLLDDAVC
ncbi:MAG: serine hydrolase domain-containing protein [Microbacteriaceae bacterium]